MPCPGGRGSCTAWGLNTAPIASFGPFLAALLVLALTEGKAGIVGLLRRMVRWRVGVGWYAVALLLPVVMAGGATLLNVALGAEPPTAAELGRWTAIPASIAILLLVPGYRRGLGGAGLAGLRAPADAGPLVGAAVRPGPRPVDHAVASAADGHRRDPRRRGGLDHDRHDRDQLAVQPGPRQRAGDHDLPRGEQRDLRPATSARCSTAPTPPGSPGCWPSPGA